MENLRKNIEDITNPFKNGVTEKSFERVMIKAYLQGVAQGRLSKLPVNSDLEDEIRDTAKQIVNFNKWYKKRNLEKHFKDAVTL